MYIFSLVIRLKLVNLILFICVWVWVFMEYVNLLIVVFLKKNYFFFFRNYKLLVIFKLGWGLLDYKKVGSVMRRM